MKKGPVVKSMEERFWNRILPVFSLDPKQCWISKKVKTPNGLKRYGTTVDENGKKKYMHRLSWELHFGPIPKDLMILHQCDNPPCVNPHHLFLGTCKDNIIDMFKKGRSKITRDHIFTCDKGHLFSEHGRARPDGKRYCKKCQSNLSLKDRKPIVEATKRD